MKVYAIFELEVMVSLWSTRRKANAELKRQGWHTLNRFSIDTVDVDQS